MRVGAPSLRRSYGREALVRQRATILSLWFVLAITVTVPPMQEASEYAGWVATNMNDEAAEFGDASGTVLNATRRH